MIVLTEFHCIEVSCHTFTFLNSLSNDKLFISVLQKFQKIEEEHLKVIISYLEQYIESQKTGQVHVEGVNIAFDSSFGFVWC